MGGRRAMVGGGSTVRIASGWQRDGDGEEVPLALGDEDDTTAPTPQPQLPPRAASSFGVPSRMVVRDAALRWS